MGIPSLWLLVTTSSDRIVEKNLYVLQLAGVEDCNQAEALRGQVIT